MNKRLFEPFLDPVDGVLCIPAESRMEDIERDAVPHGLRFPLFLDRTASLSDQLAASPFAPASSRYGPFCDNIVGMNWALPDGRAVRIGERVVKSTTGYDLLRFLIGSGTRHGRALDYVLRLRPACDTSRTFRLCGDALRSVIPTLLRSSWMHWLDSVDLVAGPSPFLRVGVHCPAGELDAYEGFLGGLAGELGLSLEQSSDSICDGCPDLVLKTSPKSVVDLTLDLAHRWGVRCIGFCYCGAIHVFLPDKAVLREIVRPIESALHDGGGHWQSCHELNREPSLLENRWISTLHKEWR